MWEIEIDFIMPFNRAYVNQFCEIVYKKKDEWYIEWQRVTTNDNEWQSVTTSSTTSDNEWYNEWKRVTMNEIESQWMTTGDNEWQRVVQWMTTSGTTNESEWKQMRVILVFRMKQLCNA